MDTNRIFIEHGDQLTADHCEITDNLRRAKELLLKAGHAPQILAELEAQGRISRADTPAGDDFVRLSDTIDSLSFDEAKGVCIGVLCLMIELEDAGIYPGIVGIQNIFYRRVSSADDPLDYDICLCRYADLELMGIPQSWDLCSADLSYFASSAFLPMSGELQNLAHLRLAYKIMTAKSNTISDFGLDYPLAGADTRDHLPSAAELCEEVFLLEQCEAEDAPRDAHYIYCFVPGENISRDYGDYFDLLCSLRNTAGQKALSGTQVYESFVIPDGIDDIILVHHRRYDPIFTVDTPKIYRSGSSLNALVRAMLLIAQSKEPVYLNIIGSASQLPNTMDKNIRKLTASTDISECRLRLYENKTNRYYLAPEQITDNRSLLDFCSGIICQS